MNDDDLDDLWSDFFKSSLKEKENESTNCKGCESDKNTFQN